MRKLTFVLIAALVAGVFSLPAFAQDEDLPKVGIFKFVSHPALDANEQGIVDTLAAAGYVDGETVELFIASGEGEIAAMNTIAENFVFDENVDVIMAISTPALQAAFNVTSDFADDNPTPIFFSSVTSPYAAGVAETSCIKPAWITGSQAFAPFDQTVPLIFELVPDAVNVGYIYNSAEANSVANTEAIAPIMEELGLNMEIQEIANSSEVPTAAEALASQGVDVFFIGTDSTVVAGLEGLIAVANESEIPLIVSDPSSGLRGAVLGQGLDYYQEGVDSGRMAVAYLNGELDVATTSISRQQATALVVNLDAAAAQNVTVPQELIDTAGTIVENGEQTVAERMEMGEEEMAAATEEFLAGLECTEELIAEQQATLDAETE